MSERDDLGSFLSGFFIGGFIGAAVALLVAPQSGEETRTLIKEKGVELRDKTSASLEEAYAYAEKAAADARARAEELTKVAKQRADELKKQGQVVLEEQKARLKNVVDAAKPPKSSAKESKAEDSKK
jgi:gas vesicle protein